LALESFDEGDWEQTVVSLNLIRRSIAASDEPLSFEEEIDLNLLDEMLTTSYVGLATQAAARGQEDEAIAHLQDAVELAPEITLFAEMIPLLEGLAALNGETGAAADEEREALRLQLATLFARYADGLETDERACDALVQVENARTFADSARLEARVTELTQACDDLAARAALLETGGAILYSVGGQGIAYGIWQLPITETALNNMASTLVLADASQPQLSPAGNVLAYYNRQAGRTGLYGVSVGGLRVSGTPVQYGPNNQDGLDSPVSWDATGTQIAYSRSFDSGYPRIYVTSADANLDARELGFGRDPAWMPGADLIVFNGPNTVGQNPGLWAMGTGGSGNDRFDITNNGNDQRPVWTPDGNYLVFMSIDRSGGSSWEVYRMEWETGNILLLSDGHPKQDGLPTISPDGKWVAFLSDRDGEWKLYYVSIDGGPVRLLSEIQGQPIAWLEHSLQWVR
jgi:hypothetical protein